MNNLATIGQYLNNMQQNINLLGGKINVISNDIGELIQRVKAIEESKKEVNIDIDSIKESIKNDIVQDVDKRIEPLMDIFKSLDASLTITSINPIACDSDICGVVGGEGGVSGEVAGGEVDGSIDVISGVKNEADMDIQIVSKKPAPKKKPVKKSGGS